MMDAIEAQVLNLKWEYHCRRQEAIALSAYLAGFDVFPSQSEAEVLAAIGKKSPDLGKRLQAYLDAYAEWYDFAKGCRSQNKPSPLEGEDYKRMGDLILKRDAARRHWEQLRGN